jgi:phospholipid/cholesterol/gamma-HCH transport system permease protein
LSDIVNGEVTDEVTKARLTVQRAGDGLLQVELAGDWLAKASLPDFDPVEKEFTGGPGPIKAMQFQTRNLGRWDTSLMTFVLKCFELCKRNNVEFQAQTLPPGVFALFQLSQAVPETKEAARKVAKVPFFERLGLATLSGYQRAMADLTFVGERHNFAGPMRSWSCRRPGRGRSELWHSSILLLE